MFNQRHSQRKDTEHQTKQIPTHLLQVSSSLSLTAVPPHKIFLWDKDGQYIDCSYPNPMFGHFVGSQKLLGSRIADVLPYPTGVQLTSKIQRSIDNQIPDLSFIELSLNGTRHKIMIRIVPLHRYALGYINDLPCSLRSTSEAPPTSPTTHELFTLLLNPTLSSREQEICVWVREGKTNWEIGEILGITTSTVKFHLESIFRKLQITSRTQIAEYSSTTSRIGLSRTTFD